MGTIGHMLPIRHEIAPPPHYLGGVGDVWGVFPNCFIPDHLLVHACAACMAIAVYFLYNPGWMLFIPRCDLHTFVYVLQLWMCVAYS